MQARATGATRPQHRGAHVHHQPADLVARDDPGIGALGQRLAHRVAHPVGGSGPGDAEREQPGEQHDGAVEVGAARDLALLAGFGALLGCCLLGLLAGHQRTGPIVVGRSTPPWSAAGRCALEAGEATSRSVAGRPSVLTRRRNVPAAGRIPRRYRGDGGCHPRGAPRSTDAAQRPARRAGTSPESACCARRGERWGGAATVVALGGGGAGSRRPARRCWRRSAPPRRSPPGALGDVPPGRGAAVARRARSRAGVGPVAAAAAWDSSPRDAEPRRWLAVWAAGALLAVLAAAAARRLPAPAAAHAPRRRRLRARPPTGSTPTSASSRARRSSCWAASGPDRAPGRRPRLRRARARAPTSTSSSCRGRSRPWRSSSSSWSGCLELPVRIAGPRRPATSRAFGHVPTADINATWWRTACIVQARRPAAWAKRALDLGGATSSASPCCRCSRRRAADPPRRRPGAFRQRRIGEGGRPFALYQAADDARRRGGPRAVGRSRTIRAITRIGRFLRRTHLDELPQLVNVLRGEMSLVGPRPEQPEFVLRLERALPFYQRRHLVQPGHHRLGAGRAAATRGRTSARRGSCPTTSTTSSTARSRSTSSSCSRRCSGSGGTPSPRPWPPGPRTRGQADGPIWHGVASPAYDQRPGRRRPLRRAAAAG